LILLRALCWQVLAMRKFVLALSVLALAALACGQYVTPTASPTLPPPAPLVTPTPAAIPSPSATVTAEADTARVVVPVVNIRSKPDGEVVRQLEAGDAVVIVGCADNWCEIEPAGFVWQGCISENPDKLGCEAR
jgi:SH3 domain-containing protein